MNPTKGVAEANLAVVRGQCRPGEEITAAAYGINRASANSQMSGLVFGNLGERVTGMTTPIDQQPRHGLNGWVPSGPILLVVTTQRLMSWAIDRKVPVALVGSFEPGMVASARRRNDLISSQHLEIQFTDGSVSRVAVTGTGVGKGFEPAVRQFRAAHGLPTF